MRVITSLDVNGVLSGFRRRSDEFELPDTQSIFRSTRFGDHAFDLDQRFLMIVPMRDAIRAKAVSSCPASRGSMKVYAGAEKVAPAARPASGEEGWRMLAGKIMNVILGCKAHAVSFFW